MRTVDGVVDVAREQQADIPFVRVRFDRAAIARHGLHIADVGRALQVASGVHVVSQVMEGSAVFDLVVRLDPAWTRGIENIREVLVTTRSGARASTRSRSSSAACATRWTSCCG